MGDGYWLSAYQAWESGLPDLLGLWVGVELALLALLIVCLRGLGWLPWRRQARVEVATSDAPLAIEEGVGGE